MLEHGVYLPPSQYEAWFPSLVHGHEQIEQTLDAATRSFAEIAG
jgi:glutamate-1-semialdehyde 2,1-aminomutase